jgi:hypothetical protein
MDATGAFSPRRRAACSASSLAAEEGVPDCSDILIVSLSCLAMPKLTTHAAPNALTWIKPVSEVANVVPSPHISEGRTPAATRLSDA